MSRARHSACSLVILAMATAGCLSKPERSYGERDAATTDATTSLDASRATDGSTADATADRDANVAACPRSVCLEGAAMSGCACTSTVCSVDSYCCQFGWDLTCVKRAEVMCQQSCSQYLAVAMGSVDGNQQSYVYRYVSPTQLDEAWRTPSAFHGSLPAWGDVDNDGDADLIFGAVFGDEPRVYRNHGSDDFVPHRAIPQGTNTTSVALADFDNNGSLDVAVTNWGGKSVILRSASDGDVFAEAFTTPANANSQSVTWVDYDRDGNMDFFLSNLGGANHLYRYDATNVFVRDMNFPAVAEDSWVAAWADYDNDGDRDVMIGNESGPNRLYENNGGVFTEKWASPESEITRGVAWGDYDGDNLLDVVFGGPGEVLRVMRNNGDGTFTQKWASPVAHQTWSVAFGDYDGDGDLDIGVATAGNSSGNYAHVYRYVSEHVFALAWSSSDSVSGPLGAGIAFGPDLPGTSVAPADAGVPDASIVDAATSD